MIKTFTARLGNMRKPQTFVTYPRKSAQEHVVIQSGKAIGQFHPVTGQGVLNVKGCYFLHLSATLGARPFTLPADVLKLAIEAGTISASGQVDALTGEAV